MKLYPSYFIFLAFLFILTPAYAGSQTLTTYYPAPQGNYLNMTVGQNATVGEVTIPSGAGCTTTGASNNVVVANNGGSAQICDGNFVYSLTNTTLWKKGGTSYLYPFTPAEGVAIGSASDPGVAAGVMLGVTGSAQINGNETITGTGVTNVNLSVNGRIQSGDGGKDGGLYVDSGDSLLVGNSNGDIGFYTTTGNWSLLVAPTGNVGIGPNVHNPAATLDVQGSTNLNGNVNITSAGNLTVNNGMTITLCGSGNPTPCGTLKVGQSLKDNNYYAVYGP